MSVYQPHWQSPQDATTHTYLNAGNNTTCWWDEEQLDRARTLLVAMQNGPITLEDGWAVSYQVKIYIYHRVQESHSNVFSQENWKLLFTQKTGTQIFIAAVFIIAEIWKRIPWIKWYNYHVGRLFGKKQVLICSWALNNLLNCAGPLVHGIFINACTVFDLVGSLDVEGWLCIDLCYFI